MNYFARSHQLGEVRCYVFMFLAFSVSSIYLLTNIPSFLFCRKKKRSKEIPPHCNFMRCSSFLGSPGKMIPVIHSARKKCVTSRQQDILSKWRFAVLAPYKSPPSKNLSDKISKGNFSLLIAAFSAFLFANRYTLLLRLLWSESL